MRQTRILLLVIGCCALGQAQYPKLDAALSDLVDSDRLLLPPFLTSAMLGSGFRTMTDRDQQRDAHGRVLVDLYLDGTTPLNQVVTGLTNLGVEITGVNPSFGSGALSAYVPVPAIRLIALRNGVNVMKLARKPMNNVGNVTSQGTLTIHSDVANANGFTGTGITVGVMSDSYDTSPSTFTTIRAANDIGSNDLPVPKVVVDLAASSTNTDEGRAMMQIVHDVAPGASLCFETAYGGEATFAAHIRDLRTNPSCLADVIVDDVFYFDEPFFSDGQVAQAVNDVATSAVLPGKKVAYFSAAGNQGSAGGGGSIDVPAAVFSTTPAGIGNIDLSSAATCTSSPATGSTKADVGGGWLDFGSSNFVQAVNYNSAGSQIILQWDDPFYSPGGVTTDLNWYLFNSAGACVFTFATNNFTPKNGIEVIGLSGGSSGAYRIMIARTSVGTHLASRVRMVNLGGFSGGGFTTTASPATFGHSAAANAIGVAAYRYSSPYAARPVMPAFESFSSPGPVTIVFDAAGNRLAVPETRKKPDIASPDGGDTTFFYPGSDNDATGFPNFFGTSAAAPHAAGVAALLLGKAGGPATLTPPQIKSILQTTAPARVVPFSGGTAVKGFSVFDGFGLIDAVNALAKLP